MRPRGRSRFIAAVIACVALLISAATFAGPREESLAKQQAACEANISYFRGRIDSVTLWSNVFVVTGAVVAAIGSALAGFLKSGSQRKAAAVIGAVGAVVTVLPKILPDRSTWEHRLRAYPGRRVAPCVP
jgi:hypothetical protein